MKYFAAASIAATFVGVAHAHAVEFGLWVDGKDMGAGKGTYYRAPPSNSPVKDLTSNDVMCNVGGTTAVSGTVEIPAGSAVSSEWFHDTRNDDIIDGSHKGPIVAYLAPADVQAGDASWVKIAEDGFDGTNWAVTNLIANGGKYDFTMPSDLAAGDYLLRVEILALHESDTLFSENSARGIQLYAACNQITVTGSGSTSLPAGVAFPGAYKDSDAGIHFNLYGADASTYVIPGPAVWDGASSGSAPATSVATTSAAATTAAATTSAAQTSAAAPATSAAAPATSAAAPATSAAAPATSAAAPASSSVAAPASSAVPTTRVVTTSNAPATSKPLPTSSTAAQPSGGASTGQVDANVCMNSYNKCIAQTQPNPDWTGCEATKNTCLSGATYNFNMHQRAVRDGKFGRLL